MAKPSDLDDVCQATALIEEASPPTDSALDDLIGYAMRRAQLKLFQNLIGRLSAHDLRPAQFSALAIIEQNPGLMQADLAKALAIEPPQVVPLLNKLESRALAVRVRCKPDKRSYGIFLSKTGETLLRELKQIAIDSDLDSTSALNDQERQDLLRLLKKVYQS
ncbi:MULTISPECIES: MarR family winged helix-turn-helix transcriptional regulator [Pseudomonas syringae group]|uniref:MarR family transcriptional regulator n=4 Tax=Pseudomonas syringae group TaxID=136849 RepID=A0A0P9L7S0_PSECA|nr:MULTISPECIES: MarR family transcriptional regulator [Pseudomonas syringae group]KAA8711942.1 MarR family transcriptional regulator [Pseudomonas cannabina]KPB71413.1 MarR family transcriptional regulator [Pseudomonas syringae pv. maculicola]KPW23627.1 Transcriptional regulator, MarR family [Pseudomonas cannabina pv. alisalensis]KPW65785.1 MarR family transcriptional regulator [Pseudomonas cannabina]MBM0138192.1 MarR family transcriptional regulator [Pseudomonas cannabina pv. alisalensis]